MKNTWKAFILLEVYLFGIFAMISCSKNESEIIDDSTTPTQEFSFYQYTQIPGSDPNNGLVAKQVLNETGDQIFFYGSFDTDGQPQAPKSMVVQKTTTDTLMNIFIDEMMRPTMIYYSNSAGVKFPFLTTYEWLSDNQFIYRSFTYDWTTETDNLDFETLVTHNNGNYTTEDIFVRSSQAGLDLPAMFQENMAYRGGGFAWPSLGNALVIGLGVAVTVGVGWYGVAAYGLYTGLLASGIMGSALFIDDAGAATIDPPIENTNSDLPPNPNDAPNPDPISTTEDPTNLLTTTSSTDSTSTTGAVGTTGGSSTSGTTGTTGTTSTSGTTATTDTLSTTGFTSTTGTTGISSTTGTSGSSSSTSTTGTTGDTLGGMIINSTKMSNQLRRELYNQRKK